MGRLGLNRKTQHAMYCNIVTLLCMFIGSSNSKKNPHIPIMLPIFALHSIKAAIDPSGMNKKKSLHFNHETNLCTILFNLSCDYLKFIFPFWLRLRISDDLTSETHAHNISNRTFTSFLHRISLIFFIYHEHFFVNVEAERERKNSSITLNTALTIPEDSFRKSKKNWTTCFP